MPNLNKCVNEIEEINLNHNLGVQQLIFENSFNGKMEGVAKMLESTYIDYPVSMINCIVAAKMDA